MHASSGTVRARKCAGKRIVTSGFKPTTEFFMQGNSSRRVSRAATSITGRYGQGTSFRTKQHKRIYHFTFAF